MTRIEDFGAQGPQLLTPRRFEDNRGWFSETWSRRWLVEQGIACDFVQDNHSHSRLAGTLRGLHFQAPPHAQAKLIRVVRGSIFDVAVDIRVGSPTYANWFGATLSAENGKQLFVPEGFLHGFVTLEDDTDVLYKCSAYYAPKFEGSVRFDDSDIGIDWGMKPARAILSEKDSRAPSLRQIENPFSYEA